MPSKPKEEVKRPRKRPPARTVEGQENELISLAIKLAAKQLSEGTASSQVITHFLKLGSTEQRLAMEKLASENELLRAKTESLQSLKNQEKLFEEAIAAMRKYKGETKGGDSDDEFGD